MPPVPFSLESVPRGKVLMTFPAGVEKKGISYCGGIVAAVEFLSIIATLLYSVVKERRRVCIEHGFTKPCPDQASY